MSGWNSEHPRILKEAGRYERLGSSFDLLT